MRHTFKLITVAVIAISLLFCTAFARYEFIFSEVASTAEGRAFFDKVYSANPQFTDEEINQFFYTFIDNLMIAIDEKAAENDNGIWMSEVYELAGKELTTESTDLFACVLSAYPDEIAAREVPADLKFAQEKVKAAATSSLEIIILDDVSSDDSDGTTGGTTDGTITGGTSSGSGTTGGSIIKPSTTTPSVTKPNDTKPEDEEPKYEESETTTTDEDSTTVVKTDTKGNTETSITKTDGTTSTAVVDKDDNATVEITVSEKAVEPTEEAAPVVLPMPSVSANKSTISVTLPETVTEEAPVEVVIPSKDLSDGIVVAIIDEEGNKTILKDSIATEDGIKVSLSGSATVALVDNAKKFEDTTDHWAKNDVDFVSAREIFSGVSETTFEPESKMTRGMLTTVLARLDGVDTTGGENWFDKGLTWAKENNISDGTAPESNVTREQLATMLYRYGGSPETEGELTFVDSHEASEYAIKALAWAVEQGIITGVGDNKLDPKGLATRAQLAAIMARFLKK